MLDYPKEQLRKLFEKLPQELKEAIFAAENAEYIDEISKRYGLDDEKGGNLAIFTGRVLLGILSPEDFQETLEEELKLEKEKAKKVAQEINRFIFYPVKESLRQLYSPEIMTEEAKPAEEFEEKKEKEKPTGPDVYREPIE